MIKYGIQFIFMVVLTFTNSLCLAEISPEEISAVKPFYVSPRGKLAKIFNPKNKNSELERQKYLNLINGKIIEWSVTIDEIKKIGQDEYLITTKQDVNTPVCELYMIIQEKKYKKLNNILKEYGEIRIKGQVEGATTDNKLVIRPAIISPQFAE